VLGNNGITKLCCNVTSISSVSDIRDKTGIKPLNNGLNITKLIKPIVYQWNSRDPTNTKRNIEYGFSAQNLLEVKNSSLDSEYLDVVDETDPNSLKIRPTLLIPILIKAIKELNEKNMKLMEYIKSRESKK
jgi:hypothetical protein